MRRSNRAREITFWPPANKRSGTRIRLLLMLWTAPPPARECHGCGCFCGPHDSEELSMQTITTIGLDIAKSVFQVHGVDVAGQVVIRRQLKRRYVLAFFRKLQPA